MKNLMIALILIFGVAKAETNTDPNVSRHAAGAILPSCKDSACHSAASQVAIDAPPKATQAPEVKPDPKNSSPTSK